MLWMPDREFGLLWERSGVAQVRGGPQRLDPEYQTQAEAAGVEG